MGDNDVLWNPLGRARRRAKDRKLICSDVRAVPEPRHVVPGGVPSPVGALHVGACERPIGTAERCELAAKSLKKKYIGVMTLGRSHWIWL